MIQSATDSAYRLGRFHLLLALAIFSVVALKDLPLRVMEGQNSIIGAGFTVLVLGLFLTGACFRKGFAYRILQFLVLLLGLYLALWTAFLPFVFYKVIVGEASVSKTALEIVTAIPIIGTISYFVWVFFFSASVKHYFERRA